VRNEIKNLESAYDHIMKAAKASATANRGQEIATAG